MFNDNRKREREGETGTHQWAAYMYTIHAHLYVRTHTPHTTEARNVRECDTQYSLYVTETHMYIVTP